MDRLRLDSRLDPRVQGGWTRWTFGGLCVVHLIRGLTWLLLVIWTIGPYGLGLGGRKVEGVKGGLSNEKMRKYGVRVTYMRLSSTSGSKGPLAMNQPGASKPGSQALGRVENRKEDRPPCGPPLRSRAYRRHFCPGPPPQVSPRDAAGTSSPGAWRCPAPLPWPGAAGPQPTAPVEPAEPSTRDQPHPGSPGSQARGGAPQPTALSAV